jgi:ectoine hydroxylase-related dioxygenase (phytanoyl-CoA dioxygenase family)
MWFDKQPEANWRVPWHQDVHIPVTQCIAEGWGPWSQKDGMPYVVAPEPWLSRRIALRLHVDACDENKGPLQIIPGSHRHGRLSAAQIDNLAANGTVITVVAQPGDVLVMHPLLLHRSAPARQPSHRRVVHVEWCDAPLPPEAMWLDAHP